MFKPRTPNARPAVQTGTTRYRSLLVAERSVALIEGEPGVPPQGEALPGTIPATAPKKPHRDAI